MSYRERQGQSRLTNVIAIDEAHRLIGAQRRDDLQDDFLNLAARTARKRGICILVADQTPSEIPVPIISNLGTRIVMRLIEGHSVRAVGSSMSLTQEQMMMLPGLPPRTAVVHSPIHPSPFIIEIPEIKLESFSSEAAVQMTAKEKIQWTPVIDFKYEQPEEENHKKSLSKAAMDYLVHIAEHPFMSCTERDEASRVQLWKGSRIRMELQNNEVISVHKIRTGKRGGQLFLTEITDKGYEFLESIKVKVSKLKGKGGFLHKAYQHVVKQWFESNLPGCTAAIEDGTDKLVDVGIRQNGSKIAVEILVNGQNKELSNIAKDLEEWDEVILASEKQDTLDRLKAKALQELGEDICSRVSFRLLSSFLSNGNSPKQNNN